jgi:thiol-disulfide isomerase/thioredoxin
MNQNTGIIVGIIVVALIGIGVYVSMNDKENSIMMKENAKQQVMENKPVTETNMMENKEIQDKDMMMKKEDVSIMKKDADSMNKADTMMNVGSYEAYAPEKIKKAATGNVVLFFRAGWCPTCKAVDADIKAHLEKIPADLTILDVDYDNSSDLKKKYGVTYQHTFVQVDANGSMIKKWSGSPTLNSLISEIK